ncbi:GNAT family N-acetyltransferase [Brevibacillus sp. FSL K6-2834]|uniref:GNAT family N-acetyltransferase n=1 Tax=Brevibacillus sp. FSL K6-2834 TaxID=2954680 RepID=UPI0031587402
MKFTLKKAALEEKSIISNLLELYNHDFSEYMDLDVDEQGRYGYPYLDNYWTEPDRFPFLIQAEGKWAGFVLVRKIADENHLGSSYFSIAEFFIMRKYRRSGIGKAIAHQVFRMFPGHWEVVQLASNVPAQLFWRKTISEYTNGDFQEWEEPGKVYQSFVSLEKADRS